MTATHTVDFSLIYVVAYRLGFTPVGRLCDYREFQECERRGLGEYVKDDGSSSYRTRRAALHAKLNPTKLECRMCGNLYPSPEVYIGSARFFCPSCRETESSDLEPQLKGVA